MHDPRRETRARSTAAPHPDGHAGSARAAPRPEKTGNGKRRGHGERSASEAPKPALHGLLRGLRAGDLETVLLTVAIAADENRMPCADADEERRILRFLARLAEHDAALPPPRGPGSTRDGIDAGDGAPAR